LTPTSTAVRSATTTGTIFRPGLRAGLVTGVAGDKHHVRVDHEGLLPPERLDRLGALLDGLCWDLPRVPAVRLNVTDRNDLHVA